MSDKLRWIPVEELAPPLDGTCILARNDQGDFCVRWETTKTYGDADFDWWYVDDGKEYRPLRGGEPTHWFSIASLDAIADELEAVRREAADRCAKIAASVEREPDSPNEAGWRESAERVGDLIRFEFGLGEAQHV
jgi:hypothetical protein